VTPGSVRLRAPNGMGGSLRQVGALFVVLVTLVVVVMTLASRVHLPAMVGFVLVGLAFLVAPILVAPDPVSVIASRPSLRMTAS
jgi:NhaP-type Na+/H+ or K+/H+ antiporter